MTATDCDTLAGLLLQVARDLAPVFFDPQTSKHSFVPSGWMDSRSVLADFLEEREDERAAAVRAVRCDHGLYNSVLTGIMSVPHRRLPPRSYRATPPTVREASLTARIVCDRDLRRRVLSYFPEVRCQVTAGLPWQWVLPFRQRRSIRGEAERTEAMLRIEGCLAEAGFPSDNAFHAWLFECMETMRPGRPSHVDRSVALDQSTPSGRRGYVSFVTVYYQWREADANAHFVLTMDCPAPCLIPPEPGGPS